VAAVAAEIVGDALNVFLQTEDSFAALAAALWDLSFAARMLSRSAVLAHRVADTLDPAAPRLPHSAGWASLLTALRSL
jgi:hypothetical protein